MSDAVRRKEREQTRLREASKCAACKAIWAQFSDDFCEVHAEVAWHLAYVEVASPELVPLVAVQRDLGLSIESRDRAIHLLGIDLKFRDDQLMITPDEELLLREEFRRRKPKKDAGPIVVGSGRESERGPLLLPALRNCSGISFDHMFLSDVSSVMFKGYSFRSASFRNCVFSNVDFSGLMLNDADFSSSTFEECNFARAELIGTKFLHTSILRTEFHDASLNLADFTNSTISSSFTQARLAQGVFAETLLRGSNFEDANLFGADFSRADLRDANFRNADLQEAKLDGAQVSAGQLDNVSASVPDKSPRVISAFFRQHLNEDGSHKKGYESADEAALAASRLEQAEGRKVNSYNCRICSKWHIGHKG